MNWQNRQEHAELAAIEAAQAEEAERKLVRQRVQCLSGGRAVPSGPEEPEPDKDRKHQAARQKPEVEDHG